MSAKINPSNSKFKWSLNEHEINIDENNVKTFQKDDIITLSINNLKHFHAGKWSLTASANNESSNDSINLIILGNNLYI